MEVRKEVNMNSNISPLLGSMFLRRCKQRLGKLILPNLPISQHCFRLLRWEARASWINLMNMIHPAYIYRRKRISSLTDLSVNVACGNTGKNGWINLDLMAHRNVTLRYDCRRGLPLREGSAARIRCEHFLEHLHQIEEAPYFLRSCNKSLKEGGVLRLVVPDAGLFLLMYPCRDHKKWESIGWGLYNLPSGMNTAMDIINFIFRAGGEHAYAYDFDTLSEALRAAGFHNIQQMQYGVSLDNKLCEDVFLHNLYSLYVDAVK